MYCQEFIDDSFVMSAAVIQLKNLSNLTIKVQIRQAILSRLKEIN